MAIANQNNVVQLDLPEVPIDDDMQTLLPEDLEAMVAEAGTEDILTEEEAEILHGSNTSSKVNKAHYANLAAEMDKKELDKIAQDLIELVEQDDNSRSDWNKRVEKGIKILGVAGKNPAGADFDGSSDVVHPILMESVTQFQARAIQEMWPSGGPVSTQVLGQQTPERMEQAERVADYMNYLYTVGMPEAFTEEDNMLLRLPISGSCFKKMYYDTLKDRLTSTFVEPADFIVSYPTTDLKTSPRFTHRIREYQSDVKKKESTGYYVETDPVDVNNEDTDKPIVIDAIDDTEGKDRVTYDESEDRATMYEVYCDYALNVPGNDQGGKILEPYIITIDRDQQRVKRIQRNWKPDDSLKSKRLYFTHYKFTPGLGFYGYGFLHLIGDLAVAATGALRSLLDAAGFANLQGGFKARDSRINGDEKPIGMGEWREVDSTAEELNKAFFPIPYKEPSATLFNLLGYLDEKASEMAGITEMTTGETNSKNAPVGTTAMLLEQGTKVFTSIHKRLHEAHKLEFKIMAELIEEYMPDDGYPYLLGSKEGTLLPSDFDDRIDVIPVSDPNVASTAQRVAKAQSVLELKGQFPDLINAREAVKRMLQAIQVPDIDGLIGSEEDMIAQMQEEAAKAEEQRQLDMRRQELELDKMEAETERLRSEAVQRNLESMTTALESAAAIGSNIQLVPLADALLKAAGFDDLSLAGQDIDLLSQQIPEDIPPAPAIPGEQYDEFPVPDEMKDMEDGLLPPEEESNPPEIELGIEGGMDMEQRNFTTTGMGSESGV